MSQISKLSAKILFSAYQLHASDIHFYPVKDQTNIYFRVHGKRMLYQSITYTDYQLLLSYYKFNAKMDIGEVRVPQNGTIHDKSTIGEYSLRLSTLPLNYQESLAIRILPQEKHYTIDQLFIFPNQVNTLKKWIRSRAGIVLMTGSTGSGKSTTLYALLESVLEEGSYQTITLEDPIEKKIHNVLQVQVNEKAGITYQTGLKAALRHDPDIIMIGEIRDDFTAKFAFEAALTGHLVLSTLHAKDTIGTIHRLLEMGIKSAELSQSLIAVASIQLVPVQIDGSIKRRAAILEFLEGRELQNAIKGGDQPKVCKRIHSFHHLGKKAFAYGFISEETFKNL